MTLEKVHNPDAPEDSIIKEPKMAYVAKQSWANFIGWTFNIVLSILVVFNLLVSGYLYQQTTHNTTVITEIRLEQLKRTNLVYNKTKDRLFRYEFISWLEKFIENNKDKDLDIPILQDMKKALNIYDNEKNEPSIQRSETFD